MSLSLPLYKREVQDPDNKPLRSKDHNGVLGAFDSINHPARDGYRANSHTCDSRMMYTVRARDVPCEDPSQCPYGPKAHSHSFYEYSKVDKKKVKCGDRAEQVWRANQKRLLAEKQEGEFADEARPGSSSDQNELIRLFAKPNTAKKGDDPKLRESGGESSIKSTAEPEKLSGPVTFGPSQCSLPESMIRGPPLIPSPYLSAGGWTFPRPQAEAEKKDKEREQVMREAEKVRVEMTTPIMKQSQEDEPQQEKTQKEPEEEAEAKKQMWRQINENTARKQAKEQESQARKVGEENALKTGKQRLTDQQRHWEELRNRVLVKELRLNGTLLRNTAQETGEHILNLANKHVQYYELKVKHERKEREDHVLKLKQEREQRAEYIIKLKQEQEQRAEYIVKLKQEWERRAEHVVLRQQQKLERELEIGQQHELELEKKQREALRRQKQFERELEIGQQSELERQKKQREEELQRQEHQAKQRQQQQQQEERALKLKKFYEDEKKTMEQQRREELQRQEEQTKERQREEYELQMKQREEQQLRQKQQEQRQQEQQEHELRQKQRQEIIIKQQQRQEAIHRSRLELQALQSGVRQREAELVQKQRQELEFKQEQQRQLKQQQAEKEAKKKQTEASDGKPGSSKPMYNPEQGYADMIETIKNWQLSATKGIQCISEELGRISATAAKAEELAELDSVSTEVRVENETVAKSAEASKATEAEADAEREIPPFSLGSPLSPVIDPRNWSHPDANQSRRMVYRLVKKEDDIPTFDVVSYEDAKDPADEFLITESVNCQNGKDCKMCNCRNSRQEPSQAGIKRALPLEFFDDDFVLI
ncbi:hypothetical protein BDP81DRAFT_398783 [Colletotrichum phormii]|uniref:Uncharacterized protein n=1 Tax=Colletotrichum phormii TaxID=359342 RepID=A0AAI9ZHB3_9PEZI|nr:uncharacterized protein BDP81DRAFT_398783 [Colletotrichum phormii]KAK1624277.1 hypothetical protein BDP81DRAFT_398783 [Colletotrichum phormii]